MDSRKRIEEWAREMRLFPTVQAFADAKGLNRKMVVSVFRREGLRPSDYCDPSLPIPRKRPAVAPARRQAPPWTPPTPVRTTPRAEEEIPCEWEETEPQPTAAEAPAPTAETSPYVSAEIPDVDLVADREEEIREKALKKATEKLVEEVRELRARQKFLDVISAYRPPPCILPREKTSGLRELTAIALASDWHVEEPVEPPSVAYRNEYNLEIAAARIDRFFQGIIWNVEHQRASKRLLIRDLVTWLGGDLMTGYIHPELVESVALSPTETILWLMPRIRDGLLTLLEVLGLESLTVVCSFGNHGRTTDKVRVSTGYSNSYEWLMYNQLAELFNDEPRVRFEITPSAHQYAEVFGHTIHFHHGDDVRYQGGVGGLGIPLLKAVPMWDRVRPAHVHCIGHHHTLRDFGRAISNGSLIGYGPYSQRIRSEFEEPKQALFYIDSKRGKCMVTDLWVQSEEERARFEAAAAKVVA